MSKDGEGGKVALKRVQLDMSPGTLSDLRFLKVFLRQCHMPK